VWLDFSLAFDPTEDCHRSSKLYIGYGGGVNATDLFSCWQVRKMVTSFSLKDRRGEFRLFCAHRALRNRRQVVSSHKIAHTPKM
jgi:hypothetical protein